MENDNIYAASRQEEWREQLRKSMSPKERTAIERVKMPELAPDYRITCNEEVNQGITAEMALLTKKYDIPTECSLNAVMVDGTGMCGACRVSVGGKTRFVCVEGPEFDAHQVDFDGLLSRLRP